MHKVYELRSGSKVEYVGYTTNTLPNRLYDHVKRSGYFPNRKDITIHEASVWNNKQEALQEERRLKESYGMYWGESKGGKTNRLTTVEIAQEIKSKYVPYKYTQSMLAREYNLPLNTIVGITREYSYLET